MTLALLILILAHLAGPGLAECPGVSDTQRLERRVKALQARNFLLEKGLIEFGIKVDRTGRVWR